MNYLFMNIHLSLTSLITKIPYPLLIHLKIDENLRSSLKNLENLFILSESNTSLLMNMEKKQNAPIIILLSLDILHRIGNFIHTRHVENHNILHKSYHDYGATDTQLSDQQRLDQLIISQAMHSNLKIMNFLQKTENYLLSKIK